MIDDDNEDGSVCLSVCLSVCVHECRLPSETSIYLPAEVLSYLRCVPYRYGYTQGNACLDWPVSMCLSVSAFLRVSMCVYYCAKRQFFCQLKSCRVDGVCHTDTVGGYGGACLSPCLFVSAFLRVSMSVDH